MAVTSTTSLTEIVNAEWIDPRIADYLHAALVITPLCREIDLSDKRTTVASAVRWIADAAADFTEGSSTYTPTELETTDTTITAAEVGIVREPTETLMATSLLGEVGLGEAIARDGGTLCAEMLEDDLAALFPSITASVSDTGVDLTVAHMFTAVAKRRAANVNKGQGVFVLDDQQASDLTVAVAAATTTIFSNGAGGGVLGPSSGGYINDFFGHPVYYSTLCDTANTGADVVGALLNFDPTGQMSTLGYAVLWMPRLKTESNVLASTDYHKISACWGAGLIYNATAVKLVTDA